MNRPDAALQCRLIRRGGPRDRRLRPYGYRLAARELPLSVPVSLLITTDEEITKEGARELVQRWALARAAKPKVILVVEPTKMIPVRGHHSHILFTCVATGVQAHSSTGLGRKALFDRLRTDTALQERDYDPVFSDFNLVLGNHGAAINVTVPKATARLKFRYSAQVDPAPVLDAVYSAAKRASVMVTAAREGSPPELPADRSPRRSPRLWRLRRGVLPP